MKRVQFWIVSAIAIGGIPFVVHAGNFTGPPTCTNNEPCNNVPGVIWNVNGTAATQPTAQIDIGEIGRIQKVRGDIGLSDTAAFRVDKAGAAIFNMGNWFGGPAQPLTFSINGDLHVNDFAPGGNGAKGRVQATQFCFNPGNPADCLSAWPAVGGGGTISTITNGGGLNIVNPNGPNTTLSVTDNYVNTTGDTMTGTLNINTPVTAIMINGGSNALTVNGGTAGNSAVVGTNTLGGFGVRGNGSGGVGGYGGFFTDNMAYSYVGGQSYGLYTNGTIYTSGNVITLGGLCLSGVCKNVWPTASASGANGQLQFNNAGALGADAQLYWDNAAKTFGVNAAPSYAKMQVSTSADNQVAGKFVATGNLTDVNMKPFGVAGVYAEGNYGVYASSSYDAGRFVNGTTGPVSTDLATPGGYGIDTVTKSPVVYAGYFRNIDAAGTTYGSVLLGGRNYSLYSNSSQPSTLMGNLSLAPSSNPTVNGNFFLPTTGAIGFDGNRDNTATMQLWSDNNFYWDMGTAGHLYLRASGGVTKFDLDASTGNASKSSGGGSWLAYSDKRLKSSITDYGYGLDEIGRIQPVNFQYTKNNPLGLTSGKQYVGVVAQDLQKIMPEAVTKNANGYLNVDNDYVIWASVNAIKDLKAENEALKARLETLEAKIK